MMRRPASHGKTREGSGGGVVSMADKHVSEASVESRAEIEHGAYVAPNPRSGYGPKPGGVAYHAVKRVFDLLFSFGVTVVLAIPVACVSAAIVLEDPGSPFFIQERVGQGGRTIRILKLRSMYRDAHTCPERYLNEEQLAHWEREQKVDNDPRVTKVGRILRDTSLDELPQFLNVLKGDLSVIGPRPVTEEETWEYGSARDEILACRPGITGWWQVTERNDATWATGERQALELFYARHACFGLDVRIFVRTFKAMVRKTGQ